MNNQKEKDIQKVLNKVLNVVPNIQYTSNGDWTTCPFCLTSVHWEEEHIENLKHDKDCAYLIAKDLSTNGG